MQTRAAPIERRQTLRLFGVDVDNLDLDAACDAVMDLARSDRAHSVVTTNLDHVVKLPDNSSFQEAYRRASLVVADGAPFVLLSRMDGSPLRERVAGSDMIIPLCSRAAHQGLSVFFLGSTLARLGKAANRLYTDIPGLTIAGVYAPPLGFDSDETAQAEALNWLDHTRPDLIFVALGAPKQEVWSTQMLEKLDHGVFLNIGAGLDFLSGEVARAPKLFQRTGMEWAYRALSEPGRLGPRYLGIIARLPGLLVSHYRDRA